MSSAIYPVSVESALRHLNGSWHAFICIDEAFSGLLLPQRTAGAAGRWPGSVWGQCHGTHGFVCQWAQLMGSLGPVIPEAETLRTWNPHFLIVL